MANNKNGQSAKPKTNEIDDIMAEVQKERLMSHKKPSLESVWTKEEISLCNDLVARSLEGEFKLKDIYAAQEKKQIFGDKKKGTVERQVRRTKARMEKEALVRELKSNG